MVVTAHFALALGSLGPYLHTCSPATVVNQILSSTNAHALVALILAAIAVLGLVVGLRNGAYARSE